MPDIPPRLPFLDLQPLQPGGKGGETIFNQIQRTIDGSHPNARALDQDLVEPPALQTAVITATFDQAANSCLRASGNWTTDGYKISQSVQVTDSFNNLNDGLYLIVDIVTGSTTDDTLIFAEPLAANETATASVDVDVAIREDGLLYLINGTGTNAWLGQDDNLALHYSGWIYIPPFEGMTVWIQDEDRLQLYDGTNWVNGGDIPDSDSDTVKIGKILDVLELYGLIAIT